VFFMMMTTIDVSRETFFSSRNWANLEEYHIDKEREKRIGGNKIWVQGSFTFYSLGKGNCLANGK